MKQIESLYEVFCHFKDPRARNSIYSIEAMLSIITMAILSGHRNVVQIARFAKRMNMSQRKALGLPRFADGSKYYKHPSYNAFYNLLRKLDADLFALTLSEWLLKHAGALPAALAMDGKFIRDTVGLVCLCDHETGVPHGMIIASQKKGEGAKCEMKASQTLISQMPSLANKEITTDALDCQQLTAQLICANGGEFTIQVKDNQPTVLESAELKTQTLSPLFAQIEKAHGRIDGRSIAIVDVEPMQVDFPHVQTVLKVWRNSSAAKTDKPEIAYYLSSKDSNTRTPEQWLQLIRNHWAGCEIRNHWSKDACLFEDKTDQEIQTLLRHWHSFAISHSFSLRNRRHSPHYQGLLRLMRLV